MGFAANMFLQMAEVISAYSPSPRANVGCIITDAHGRILSHATNTCDDLRDIPSSGIHAEINALSLIPRSERSTEKIAFVTISPCSACARMLVRANVRAVYFRYPYREGFGTEELLKNKVKVFRITQNGNVLNLENN